MGRDSRQKGGGKTWGRCPDPGTRGKIKKIAKPVAKKGRGFSSTSNGNLGIAGRHWGKKWTN